MDPSKQDIRFIEPSSAEGLMPTTLSWETWLVIGGIVLLLVLAIVFIWVRRRRSSTSSPEDIRKKAHDEAIAAFSVCPSAERTPAATECSLILRRYLAGVSGDKALFETHDEWVARHDSIESLDENLRTETHKLFTQLAEWKYAPADHGDEPATIIDRSRQLLEAINRGFAA